MQDKYDGIDEIYNRIKTARSTIGLRSFRWAEESTNIKGERLPCVFVGSGDDLVVKYNSRSHFGYPANRMAHVIIELVSDSSDDIKSQFDKLRQAIFTDCSVSKSGIIRELKSSGITNYNMPNIKAITLIVGLYYIDSGI